MNLPGLLFGALMIATVIVTNGAGHPLNVRQGAAIMVGMSTVFLVMSLQEIVARRARREWRITRWQWRRWRKAKSQEVQYRELG